MHRTLSACGFLLIFLMLAVTTWAVWQFRFAGAEDQPAWVLGYTPTEVIVKTSGEAKTPLKGESVRLVSAPEAPRIVYRWEGSSVPDYVYISLTGGCENLEVGQFSWSDARVMMKWVDQNGSLLPDFLPIWSARGTHPPKFHEAILPMKHGNAIPCLVVENLGRSGVFTLESLTVQPVVLQAWVRWSIPILVLGWVGFIACTIRVWIFRGVTKGRATLAATVATASMWYGSLPGPWLPWQPLISRYPIVLTAEPKSDVAPVPAPSPGESSPPAVATTPAPPPPESNPPPSSPAPPERLAGTAVRWFTSNLPMLKRPVHILAFAGLTAVLAFVIGSRRAAYLAGSMAFGSEFCQWAFGFGVDWGDALDLATDAIAVLLGITAWRILLRYWHRKRLCA